MKHHVKSERAALKRQTAELVAEELERYHSPRYWENELDALFGELQDLECEEERDLEFYETYGIGYDAEFYTKAYRELLALILDVEYELAMAA